MATTPTLLSVISNALIEARWLAQGEQPEAQDALFVLGKINDQLDQWSAEEKAVFASIFTSFTLQPGLSPHTIGPAAGATFSAPTRPIRIDGGAIRLPNNDGTFTDVPIDTTRDADWWNFQRIKSLQSQIPTDLYYEPDVPNGSLYFWPVPNANYNCLLRLWQSVAQFKTINDTLILPPAYRKAITLTIAEQLDGPRSADEKLALSAEEARQACWQNNAGSPTMSTMQAGMPEAEPHTNFNFLDGTPWG